MSKRICRLIAGNELLLALVVVLAMVLLAVSFGWENNKLIPVNPAASAHFVQSGSHLSFLSNWDGPDYIAIAQHGYSGVINTNFFPLYPLLIYLVNLVIGSPLYSALLVSWACLVGAVCFYLKIIKLLYDETDNLEALRGVLFFVLFPTGVFLLATYTESLFAFLALGAIYFGLQKRWLPAALLAMFSTAAHANGIFVVIFVALLLLEEERERWQKVAGSLVIGSLGLLAYMAYLQLHFHRALAFIDSQRTNGWLKFSYSDYSTALASRNGLFLLLLVAAVVYWWNRRRTFAIYSLMYVAIALLGGLGGFGRYALMAFPIQLMLYDHFRDKKLGYSLALALSAVFWTYFLLQYAGGYTGG